MNLQCVLRHSSIFWNSLNSKISQIKPVLLVFLSVSGTIIFTKVHYLLKRSEKSIFLRFFLILFK